MLFDDLIRRRVASLLQPWLREEPELEMKLGFLGSHGIVKNLRFDTSVLNQLIDESTRLSFKDVTTEHISIRMSYWSAPAFTIEIRGIHVTLSVREQTEEGSAKRMQQSKDTFSDDIKKTLSLIDPEGTALHDVLERISATTSTNWLKTSLLNLIIKYCRLQMLGVHLHVQVPFSDDSFMCSLEANEFNAESKPRDHGCLLRGFAGAIIFPLKESSLTLQGRGFGIRLKSKDKVSQVISSTDMSTCLRLKDLQLVHFNLCVPELNFSFFPVDLALIVAIDRSLSVESICARNGRQLWKLAADRIGSLVSTYRFSLHKLVGAVCIWLRYVNTYEYLLLLVGYSVDNLLKRSAVMMSRDNKFSSSVKHHWKVITEIEKKLPAEAIARARRIARYRAALHAQFENTNTKSLVNNDFKFFSKILQLLVFVWKFICFVFYSFVHFFCLRTFAAKYPRVEHLGIVSEESCQLCCFCLNLGRVSITVSSKNEVQLPIDEKLQSLGISRLDLLSFCLTLDALFLIYNEDICEQSLSISCGHLKFMSSSVIGTPVMEGSKKNFFSSSKGHLKGRVNDSKTIVWGEPAKMFPISKDCRIGTSKHTEGGCVPFLEEFLGQMWSSWNKSCMIFEENEIQHLEKPCLLFEIKYSLTDSGLRNPNSGFWKCGLTVGKLNFALGYSSILSIALVCRQVQYALYWPVGDGRARVLPHSSQSIGNSPENNWDSKYSWCASRMKMEMLRILPEKHIQLGVLIAGPHIRMSLRTEDFCSGNEYVNYIINQDDLHLAFDFHNIELVVSPTLKSELASMAGYPGLDDLGCLGLTEPQTIEIPRSDNENYISQGQISLGAYVRVNGLNVYLDDTSQNQQCQVFVVKPITIQLSTLREYLHSFSSTVVAFSAAFCGVATGFTALLYMDELSAFFQVVGGLYSVAEYAFIRFDSLDSVPHQQLMTQDMVFARPDNQTTARWVPLISKSTLLVINGTFDLKSMDIVLHKSRKSPNVESFMNTFDDSRRNFLAEYDLPDYGIWISVRQIFVEISCEEEKAEVLVGLSGIQSIIFRYQHQTGKNTDLSELKNILPQPRNCLYEMSLSNCTFTASLGSFQNASSPGSVNDGFDGSTSGSKTSNLQENSTSAIVTERSTVQSLSFDQKLGVASAILGSASNYWLVINVALTEIFIARCSVKNVLLGAHQLKKLQSSLYVGGEFQTFSWGIEGVCVFLEITALSTLVCCFASYLHCVTNIISIISSSEKLAEIDEPSVNMTEPNDSHVEEYAQGMHNTSQQAKWELLEAFTMDLSQCSLVLVFQDESSGVRELVLEADARLNLEVANMKSLFLFDLSRLSILSQILHIGLEEEEEVKIPHFSSIASKDISSDFVSGDSAAALQHRNGNLPVFDDASSSSDAVSQKEPSANNCVTELFRLCNQHCILKQLGAIVSVEKSMQEDDNSPLFLNQGWVGSGSVSGFDMTISLSEIQMILSIDVSFLEVSKKDTISNAKQRQRYNNPESDRSLEETVPDGAIVAIQDVHQHIYFAVESVEDKYILSGAIHYSLVGERSLFRVKYHRQKKWRSSVLLFSLISVHAKSVSGEPLQLNYRPGSGFVDISSINDSEWGLWSLLSYKPESYEGDIDWEPCNQLAKNTFYLVNKKNDCAVAFVDGVPEFVRKPGNPFKFKVFQDIPPPRDSVMLGTCSVEASGTSLQPDVDIGRTSLWTGILPQVDVTIKKVTLTIVDEISDTRDKFPLLRGCIDDIHLIVQNFSSKARVISTLTAVLTYFDSQRNLWRDLVPPVEMCLFYRSCFQVQASETVLDRVPVHFYFRINELDISLTELSLDILLFVIGKLNLAGPFSVRSSIFLANCCKVENQSGLNLICQFNDKQEVTIARKQSAFIFLRQLATGNQASEKAPFVSIQLAVLGVFSTSPIHLSFLKAQTLAWRTRIVSLQDSKAYPGPFLVVDISRKTEDGLKIVVSPLIKIHNETEFSMELRFQRPQQNEAEFASVLLKSGDTIDDSMAVFDALNMSGGLKKALMSLSVGNFLFSFRPEMTDGLRNFKKSISVQWSDDLKGGKAVRLSGLFDKLSYKVRKAFSVASLKCSFSTALCSLKSEDGLVSNMYFLLQSITKDVPVIQPDKSGDVHNYRNSPVALQEQKEIFLLPTVRVSNLLQSEIHVLLTETELRNAICRDKIGNQATIPCGSMVDLYANPAVIYVTVTLTALNTSCKPVNSGDWVKRLNKQKDDVDCLDIDLDFGGGQYFASLRLSRGNRGILEAAIFTSYTLKNDTDFPLLSVPPNQKHLFRDEAEKLRSSIPPELGLFLPPKSTGSWFLRSNKMHVILLEEKASEVLLDLDALSGLTEISLERDGRPGFKKITKLGMALGPCASKVIVPSQIVTIVPRYVIANESDDIIFVRQCNLEDNMEGMIRISSGQKTTLRLQSGVSKRRQNNVFENFIRKHSNAIDDSLIYVQFRLNGTGWDWSGPVCIASLGRFFLKFRKSLDFPVQQPSQVTGQDNSLSEFAAIHVVEEGSTLVLHYHKPPNLSLPYRIENSLHETSITYYQKDSAEPEVLGPETSVDYVWDNMTLPHKLVVQINDMHLLREINLDKVRPWKSLFKIRQQRGLSFPLPMDKKPGVKRRKIFGDSNGIETIKVGYEVYADGPTRVLRICEYPESPKGNTVFQSSMKIQLRVSSFAIHFLEHGKQDVDANEPSLYTEIIVARLGNISLESLFTDQQKYNQIRVQSLNVDQKWVGAPFAAMLRRHRSDFSDTNDCILHIAFILLSTSSSVKKVKYASIVLQPVDLNLDEETLMRIVPFWRTSLSDSSTPSQQFYFDHFEIHPVKIIASFLPGDSYSSYSSSQETLRSLLHSVIKIPAIKSTVVELNGVLVTHALITMRELFIKCAQHYSWYGMRAVYIAKGSPLLPPSFVSIFDDMASSSLDVFFDPSRGSISLPGLTLGTFKLISKCIDGKGFSGTKRYFGDLENTLRTAGSNVLFAAVTEISDSVLKGAETSGFNGLVTGFHQGILKLAMEPSLLGSAFMGGGPDRKITLDRSPGVDELYIEGYLQAMLDTTYKQEYLRVRVIDNQVFLKNLPPNNSLIDEIMDRVKGFLISKALLKGDSLTSHSLRHLRGESEWKVGPTVLTLCEHLFVSLAIRMLRKQVGKFITTGIKWKEKSENEDDKSIVPATTREIEGKGKLVWKWGITKFVLSGMVAYIDGRLCRSIPNPVARRIVSGLLLSFLDNNDKE